MVAAGLCWSTGGILVRSVTVTDAWEVVFWRALFMAAFIGVVLTVRHRHRALAQLTAVGLPGGLAGVLFALTFFLFILSVMRTTVANALVLMSASPFVAAIFVRVHRFLKGGVENLRDAQGGIFLPLGEAGFVEWPRLSPLAG
jgi:drug/metabolite transporter (DMT)-like permease